MIKSNKKGVCKLALSLFTILLLLSPAIIGSVGSVDDGTCLECHDGADQTLIGTLHQIGSNSGVTCEGCHKGASQHAEDPSADNISNPQNLIGKAAFDACKSCHQSHIGLDNYGYDAHVEQVQNCNSCHKVHQNGSGLLLDDKAEFCLKCHQEISHRLDLQSNHPVNDNVLNCLSCHQFTKKHDNNIMYENNRICRDCHPEQGGPFLFEHEPVNAYMVDGNGCNDCHDPHGSVNDRLLKQDLNTQCLQCHVLPGHDIAHGGTFNDLSCVTCHTQTHGSFNSKLFLDPDMPAKLGSLDCYQSGCHSLGGE